MMPGTDASNFDFTFTFSCPVTSKPSDDSPNFRGDSELAMGHGDKSPGESPPGHIGQPPNFAANVFLSIKTPTPTTAAGRLSETASTATSSVLFTPPTTPGASQVGDEPSTESPATPTPRDDGELTSIGHGLQKMDISTPLAISMKRNLEVADGSNHTGSATDRRTPSLTNPEPPEKPDAPGIPLRTQQTRSSCSGVCHDDKEEKATGDPFDETSFQIAIRGARKLMSNLQNTLATNSLHTDHESVMNRLHNEARELSDIDCSSSHTVALVGDAGVGKSSLLNSLLDCQGLLSDSKDVVPYAPVTIEYHFHDRDDFVVDIEPYTEDELKHQVSRLLQAYRSFHLNELSLEGEERNHNEKMAKAAQQALEAMFRGKFSNGPRFMEMTEGEALAVLYGCLRELFSRALKKEDLRSSINKKDWSENLAQFKSHHSEDGVPDVRYFIKALKVYMKAQILRDGLVLVDLPGLRNLNLAQRQATERYLIECSAVFAVCAEESAMTDDGVVEVIGLAKKAKLKDVGIICTRSDDIEEEHAIKYSQSTEADLTQKFSDNLEDARQAIRNITEDLKDYDRSDNDMSDGEKEEQMRLHQKLRKARIKCEDRQFKLSQHLVNSRSDITKRMLRDHYQDTVSMESLSIFCINNRKYWDCQDVLKTDRSRYIQLSGIPAVKEYCMDIISESQDKMAEHYLKHRIPSLLHDVNLWAQSRFATWIWTVQQKLDIKSALNTLEGSLKRDVFGSSNETDLMSLSTRSRFKGLLEDYRRDKLVAWSIQATEASLDQAHIQQNEQTCSAFCRNHGNSHTEPVRSHGWNVPVSRTLIEDLEPLYSQLRSSFKDTCDQVTSYVQEYMAQALKFPDTEVDVYFGFANVLLREAMETRQCLLRTDMEDVCEKAFKAMSTLRIETISGIESSFLGQSMQSAYKSTVSERSTDDASRHDAILRSVVIRDNMFQDLLDNFQNAFTKIVDGLQEELRKTMESHMESIQVTFDMVRSDIVALESERDGKFTVGVGERVKLANEEIKRLQELVGI